MLDPKETEAIPHEDLSGRLPSELPPKPHVESKTSWGILIVVVGVIGTMFGFDTPTEFLNFWKDGFQFPEDVFPLITLIGWVLKEHGHRVGIRPIKGLLKVPDDNTYSEKEDY